MTTEEFISLLKSYDFKNNSIRSFSRKYKIHYNTVSKYLRIYKINYNTKKSMLKRERDITGKFCLRFPATTKSSNPKNNHKIELPNFFTKTNNIPFHKK